MNMICKLLGHEWHPDGAEFYCVYDCMRCGHHGDGDEWNVREWITLRLYWWRYSIRKRWKALREWWKCSECGGRFGQHDYEASDHLPF